MLSERQRQFLDRAISAIEQETISVPGPHDLAVILGTPPQAVLEILRLGQQDGALVRVADGMFYTPQQLAALANLLRVGTGGKPFGAPEAREIWGTNRRYAAPLLEHFDAIGVTIRTGGSRTIAPVSD